MSFISDLITGGADKIITSVGNVIDSLTTTREEKLQLANELAKAEMQYELDKQKMSLEEQTAILGDIANARQREVQVQASETATKLSKNITNYLALGTTCITLILFFVLIFRPGDIPPGSKEIILYILGILSTILVQIYSYYFGSSSGSAAKDKTISSLTK